MKQSIEKLNEAVDSLKYEMHFLNANQGYWHYDAILGHSYPIQMLKKIKHFNTY